MNEPLTKNLSNEVTATLSEQGVLTLTEVQHIPVPDALVMDGPEEMEPVITEIALSAQAVRGLLNFLRTQAARDYHGGRK